MRRYRVVHGQGITVGYINRTPSRARGKEKIESQVEKPNRERSKQKPTKHEEQQDLPSRDGPG